MNGPIGQSEIGAGDGISRTTHDIALWLENEPGLLERARDLIGKDYGDGRDRFREWVGFLLFGDPTGGYNLNTEPKHDARTVMDLKHGMDRDDFRRVNWMFVRSSVTGD